MFRSGEGSISYTFCIFSYTFFFYWIQKQVALVVESVDVLLLVADSRSTILYLVAAVLLHHIWRTFRTDANSFYYFPRASVSLQLALPQSLRCCSTLSSMMLWQSTSGFASVAWCNCFYVFVVLEIGLQRNSYISCFFILLRSKFFSTGTSETQMCQGETESDLREILTFLSAACLEQFWGENLPGRKYVWNYGMMALQPWHNHGNHPFQL